MCVLNNSSQYKKQRVTELKGNTDKSVTVVRDVTATLSMIKVKYTERSVGM